MRRDCITGILVRSSFFALGLVVLSSVSVCQVLGTPGGENGEGGGDAVATDSFYEASSSEVVEQGAGVESLGGSAPEDDFVEGIAREMDRLGSGDGGAAPSAADGGAAPAPADPGGTRGGGWMFYLRWIMSICLVVAGILVLGIGAKRLGSNTPLLAGSQFGKVLGRLYLERGVSLHFVRTGGRVLVVGVTSGAVSIVGEFDADTFSGTDEESADEDGQNEDFMKQLEISAGKMSSRAEVYEVDDELASLRRDVERLQGYLRDDVGEPVE